MAENKKIRLSRVATEYNVGIGTIAEFLEKKGITIDHSPNVVLDGAAFDMVTAEFAGEAAAKPKRETQQPEVEKVTPEKEVTIKTNIYTTEHTILQSPKIIGKINLDAPKEETRNAPKPSAEKAATTQNKVEEVVATTKVEAKIEATAPKLQVKTEEKVEVTKPTPQPVVVPTVKPKVEPKVEPLSAPVKIDEPKTETQPPVVVAPVKVVEPVAPVSTEPTLFRANEPEKLTGPKILGHMQLPVKSTDDRRGKRNRIKKNKVDLATVPAADKQTTPGARTAAGGTGAPANRNNNNSRDRKKGGKVQPRPVVREAVSDEEVQKQIKETLSRLTGKGGKNKSSKYRRDKRDAVQGKLAEEMEREQMESDTLQVTEFVTVSELASMMDATVTDVITACMNLGLMVSINQRLDAEALAIVAEEFGYKVEFVSVDIQEAIENEEDKAEELESRPPIVTVMGHVDHGKTSLLDYIRKANVIAGEAGGITQHIGAYSVKLEDGRRVTCLDTPGHEAFTAMRARGAKVTDVAIIIIAADDSIMPQTKEAINHAEAAGVPIVFAINKIDKPGANPEKIKEQLAAMNYLVEEWGGKFQSQDIAAKSGLNVDKLLEKVLVEAELLDLKANPNRKASGSVIESALDKGRGFVTTVLVHNGTLKVGDVLLSGIHTGRVKAMFNERGKKIDAAPPATPVLVLGLNGAPQAGDTFNVMDDDKSARDIAVKREQLQRMQGLRTQKHITLDEIGRRIAIGNFKELNIIVKGDVDGSIEALTDSLIKLSNEEVQVNVIHKAVGQISESDVLLAAASNAVIIGFQVRPSNAARKIAEKEEIEIRLYSIIYDAIEEIKDAIEGMLAPVTKEEITCSVEVLEVFKITKVGTVAGCMVREGKITRNAQVRIIRDGIVVYTGKLGSLKRFKDDVKEVPNGMDCGLNIENFNDMKVGDFIEGYQQVEVARKL